MKLSKKLLCITGAIALTFSLAGCGMQQNAATGNTNQATLAQNVKSHPENNQQLAKLNYKSNTSGVMTVNNNHSTLRSSQWKKDHIYYHNLDTEGRTSNANVATIDKANLANDSRRVRQTVKPVGYQQKFINGQPILNRGHMIAYSLSKNIDQNGNYNRKILSGDQNNRKNLFAQTTFSNQRLQTIYESKVRQALRNNEKVIYSAQPVFQGHDKMAKGIHLMALSTNHKLNFNVYIFNVQPGIQFNYANGSSRTDNNMKVPTPAGYKPFNDNKSRNYGFRNHYYNNYGYHHYRRHHYVRDAAILYGIHHMRRNHRRNVYYHYRYHKFPRHHHIF